MPKHIYNRGGYIRVLPNDWDATVNYGNKYKHSVRCAHCDTVFDEDIENPVTSCPLCGELVGEPE